MHGDVQAEKGYPETLCILNSVMRMGSFLYHRTALTAAAPPQTGAGSDCPGPRAADASTGLSVPMPGGEGGTPRAHFGVFGPSDVRFGRQNSHSVPRHGTVRGTSATPEASDASTSI